MYLKIKNKKIEIKELKTFKERFKSLKFNLYPIDYGLYFPKKKLLDTTFYCQRVDACFTDEDNTIMYLHSNIRSEKRKYHVSVSNLYILPVGTAKYFKVGDTLKLKEK